MLQNTAVTLAPGMPADVTGMSPSGDCMYNHTPPRTHGAGTRFPLQTALCEGNHSLLFILQSL